MSESERERARGSEGLHFVTYCSRAHYSDNNMQQLTTPRGDQLPQLYTHPAALNSMIMRPAAGLWSIAAIERTCTHTHARTHTAWLRPLHRNGFMCECVRGGVFMNVVQMVTSHCRAPSPRSPAVPRLGSSGTSRRVLRACKEEGWGGGGAASLPLLPAHVCWYEQMNKDTHTP